jgi:hypothetical protein
MRIKSSAKKITIGNHTFEEAGVQIGYDSGGSSGNYIALIPGTGIQMGHETFGSAPFSVTKAGVLKATSGTIGGFTLTSTALTGGSTGTTVALTPGTGIHMGHATFASAPFSVDKTGVLKATSGTIGGFTLSANELTATNFELNPSGKSITLGTGTNIFIVDGDVGLHLGHGTFASAPFSVTKAGAVKAESGVIGGWTLTSGMFKSSDQLMRINSSAKKITIGNHTFEEAGVQIGYDSGGTLGFYAGDGSDDYIKYITGTGVDIKSSTFLLDTTNLDIDSANKQIRFYDNSNNEWVRLGQTHNNSGTPKYGLKIFDGTGVDVDDDVIVMLGDEGNKIGGWEITGDQIRTLPSLGFGQNYGAGEVGLILPFE